LDPHKVVIRPVVTEKSTWMVEKYNAYTFRVHPKVNKQQIRDAVEKIYDVRVDDVRTATRMGKPRRSGRHWTRTSNWKRAVVVLHPDDRIEIF
jgi:large subunit ribosomal protein L23